MAAPVTIELVVDGVDQVKRALRSVTDSLEQTEKQSTRAARSQSKERVRAATDEAKQKERLTASAARAEQRQWSETTRYLNKLEREKLAEVKRSTDARARAIATAATQETRIAERAAREQVRIAEKAERDKLRAIERTARNRDRIQTNSAIAAARAITRETEATQRARTQFAGSIGGRVGASAGRAISGVATMATGLLAVGAGFGVADVARRSIDAENAANALAISMYNPLEKGSKRGDPAAIMRRAAGIERLTNLDRVDVIKGMQSYVALTGESKMVSDPTNKNAQEIAMLAKATGTSAQDMFKFAGNQGVQNRNMTPAEQMKVLRATVVAGRAGAVEISELAQYAGEITATSGQYAGNQATNQMKLLGAAQIARIATGGSADAATAIARLSSDVASNTGKMIGANGKSLVKDKSGRGLMDIGTVVGNLMEATDNNTGKLKHMGIGKEAMKVFLGASGIYDEAYRSTQGPDAAKRKSGGAAVKARFAELGSGDYADSEVKKDLSLVMNSKGERFQRAINNAKDSIETALTPALERLAQKLSDPKVQESIDKLIKGLGELAEWFISNPMKGLGAIVLGAVAKDLAAAGLGAAVKAALVSAASGYNSGGVAGGAASAGKSLAKGASAVAALAGVTAGVLAYNSAKDAYSSSGDTVTAAAGLTSKILRGTASPEEIEKAKKLQQQMRADLEEAQTTDTGVAARSKAAANNVAGRAISIVTGGLVDTSEFSQKSDRLTALQGLKDSDVQAFKDSLAILTKAMANAATQAGNGTPAAPNAPHRNAPLSAGPRGGSQ